MFLKLHFTSVNCESPVPVAVVDCFHPTCTRPVDNAERNLRKYLTSPFPDELRDFFGGGCIPPAKINNNE